MILSQISPLWRGLIGWAAMLVLFTDMFLATAKWLYRIPRLIPHLLWTLVLYLATCLYVEVNSCYSSDPEPFFFAAIARAPLAAVLSFLAASLAESGLCWRHMRQWRRSHLSHNSLKEGLDSLPTALCFYEENGLSLLTNHAMNRLSSLIRGAPLHSGLDFWAIVRKKAEQSDIPSPQEAPILRLDDGSVWSFRRDKLMVGGRAVWRITAANVSPEFALTEELERKNREIRQMNERLWAYGKVVEESTREQEILAAKVRIHDDLGKVLLASRRCLDAGPEERGAALAGWRRTVALFCCREEAPRDRAPLSSLIEAARGIGVEVRMEGEFPPPDTPASRCLIASAHECLTNAVRHANASILFIRGARQGGQWRLVFANDGPAPQGPIAEGGGLTSLRRRVEQEGGAMEVSCLPSFTLTITIPAAKEENTSCPTVS